MHPGKKLRKALAGKGLITAPGVYDMISAKIADATGFTTLYMTGFGVSATLGMPDAGLASYTEMVERVAQICQGTSTPVICDADTGFGGLLNVEHTVRGYERAGAAAIQIEDQVFPKKCGHTPGRRVVPIEQMVRKIEVATASRTSPDFLIVARTDARTNHGLDEALRRGEAIGMLPDQVPGSGEGEWVEFFGRQAYTMTLVGRLAEQTGARPPESAVQALNRSLEQMILRCPEQYLWSYNRYKVPAGVRPPGG